MPRGQAKRGPQAASDQLGRVLRIASQGAERTSGLLDMACADIAPELRARQAMTAEGELVARPTPCALFALWRVKPPDGRLAARMLPVETPDFPVDDIDPDLLHQLAAFLYAVKRKDWAAARSGLFGAGRIVDRMRRDEAAAVAPEQNWQCAVYT